MMKREHEESNVIFHNGDEAAIKALTKNKATINVLVVVVELVVVMVLLTCQLLLNYNW